MRQTAGFLNREYMKHLVSISGHMKRIRRVQFWLSCFMAVPLHDKLEACSVLLRL